MPDEVTIAELVRNGTLSALMAATLWSAVDEQRSFLTVALPRFAGKSTVSNALLALRPADVPLHYVDGAEAQMARLRRARLGGYLVVAEFSQAPVPGYIWGEPVRRVFRTLAAGYALQASLHAHDVEEALREITKGNGVPKEQASAIDLVLYIDRFGVDEASFWRRLSHVYELDRIERDKPIGRTLFRWHVEDDAFELVEEPRGFGRDREDIAAHATLLEELVRGGRTSSNEVAAAVAAYRGRQSW